MCLLARNRTGSARGPTEMLRRTAIFRNRPVCIRDIEDRDVGALVAYWHQSPHCFLSSLGVDLSKLRTPEETRVRFLASVARGDLPRDRVTFVVESERELIAYTNLNIRSGDEAYAHFHVLRDSLWTRAASYVLFPSAINVFFEATQLNKILFQTSPENRNINRMLESFGVRCRRMHLEAPDGMARPGEFNVYEIARDEAMSLARIAARKT